MNAKVIQVIVTDLKVIGDGTEKNPNRILIQYWDFDGNLLAEVDPAKCDSCSWQRKGMERNREDNNSITMQEVLDSAVRDNT